MKVRKTKPFLARLRLRLRSVRWLRVLWVSAAVAFGGPLLAILLYAVVPPPVTPLMLIRLIEGEGLTKDWTPLSRIAAAVPAAVIASEDNRFCQHHGFDWEALQDAYDDYQDGGALRGASTITMQTAKNLFLWPGRSYVRKALEAYLTPQLDLLWSKRRVMEVYLNVAEWGPGLYGVEAAAKAYFAKSAANLSSREAALLAAVLPNPRRWSPARPTSYIQRRAGTISVRVRQLGPLLDCVNG